MIGINQISTRTAEGRLLIAAIAKLTTESQTDKTPDEVLQQCAKLALEMGSKFNELIPRKDFADFELLVQQWARDKKIEAPENQFKQLAKVTEELGELCSALLKNKREEAGDAFGDILITLFILAMQTDFSLLGCLAVAWDEIKNRTGSTVDGTFIKD